MMNNGTIGHSRSYSLQNRYRWLTRKVAWAGLSCGCFIALVGCGKPFKRHEHLTLESPGTTERVIVRNRMGDIRIHTDAAATGVQAEVHKVGRGASPAQAGIALEETTVTLERADGDPQTVIAGVAKQSALASPFRHSVVDWEITAPPDITVVLESEFGDLVAKGDLRGATVETDFGDIRVDSCGPIDINTDFGDVVLHVRPCHPDNISIRTDFGDVTVRIPRKREGQLTGSTDFGSVRFRLDEGLMRVVGDRENHMDVQLGGKANPKLEITTDFGDISVKAD